MKKRLLVVVDYQKDFVDGALGFAGAEQLDIPIANKIRSYMDKDSFIVKTMDTHYSNYLATREGQNLPIEHCIYGTAGWDVYGETQKALEEANIEYGVHTINKESFGVSPSAMCYLADILGLNSVNACEIETVEFVGLVSNICLISNVVVFQSAFPNATMLVNPALTDSFDKELHQKTIDVLQGLQVKLIDY